MRLLLSLEIFVWVRAGDDGYTAIKIPSTLFRDIQRVWLAPSVVRSIKNLLLSLEIFLNITSIILNGSEQTVTLLLSLEIFQPFNIPQG